LPEENQAPDNDLDLEGLTPDQLAAALNDESSEDGGQLEKEAEPQDDVDSALSRFKVSRDDLPEALRDPAILEAAVSWAVGREKDLQAGFTRATGALKEKFGTEDPAILLADAEAFRLLQNNPIFQEWITGLDKGGETPVATIVPTTDGRPQPPEGLEGDALLDWYVDRRLEEVLAKRGYDQRFDLVSQYLNRHEVALMSQKYGEEFDKLRPHVERNMKELNVPVERAFKLARAEYGEKTDEVALRAEIKQEFLDKIEKHRGAGAVLKSIGRGDTSTTFVRRGDDQNKSYDEKWDDAVKSTLSDEIGK